MMNNGMPGMMPFDPMSFYEQPKPRFLFKMPRVVPEQKAKFESDDLFRRLSRESEIRYIGYRDRSHSDRQKCFRENCRDNGRTEVAFIASGTNLQLTFNSHSYGHERECDFDKEAGKVHIKAQFIMNGVCVRFRGWVDLVRLDGIGCLEYDEQRAVQEDAILRDQVEFYNQQRRHIEESKQRAYRPDDLDSARHGVGVGPGMWRR